MTTLLLWLYSFDPNIKITESFYYVEDPVNTTTSLLWPRFYGLSVVTLTGFHCTNSWKYIKFKALKIARRLPWICLCKIDSIMLCKPFYTWYIYSVPCIRSLFENPVPTVVNTSYTLSMLKQQATKILFYFSGLLF